jgi:hypothetical protein
LHPLALVPYELVRGRAAPTKGLLAISSGVLIAERLLTLADMALPWFLTMTAHALVTGWWVRKAYTPSSARGPAIHLMGLLAALAVGLPLLFLQRASF